MKTIPLLILCVILTGCGGSGTVSPVGTALNANVSPFQGSWESTPKPDNSQLRLIVSKDGLVTAVFEVLPGFPVQDVHGTVSNLGSLSLNVVKVGPVYETVQGSFSGSGVTLNVEGKEIGFTMVHE